MNRHNVVMSQRRESSTQTLVLAVPASLALAFVLWGGVRTWLHRQLHRHRDRHRRAASPHRRRDPPPQPPPPRRTGLRPVVTNHDDVVLELAMVLPWRADRVARGTASQPFTERKTRA